MRWDEAPGPPASGAGPAPVPEETEIKYRLADPADRDRLRARLAALGARPTGTVDEENVLFDRPGGRLAATGRLLRLRVLDGGPGGRLTYKGPATYTGPVKRRVEIETAVADSAALRALLQALGYRPTLTYAKRRETWRLDDAEVALDELAFGHFCEIEGPPAALARVAAALGLPPEAAEPATYPALAAQHAGGTPHRRRRLPA